MIRFCVIISWVFSMVWFGCSDICLVSNVLVNSSVVSYCFIRLVIVELVNF